MLERIHLLGWIYNDIKLDNIVVGDAESSPSSLSELRLIDFGFCTKYLDEKGAHIQFEKTN